MANLLGQNIGTNYKGILNLNTLNGNLTTTLEAITDGDGNASTLLLSTTLARVSSNLTIGGSTTASARLHVRGDGTNPIARFENSSGSNAWAITSGGTALTCEGQARIQGPAIANDSSVVLGSYNNLTTTSLTQTILNIQGNIVCAAGSGNKRISSIEYAINNSGAQTGTATGIFLNATETALNGMGHNLMDLQVGGVSRFRVSNGGIIVSSSHISTTAGSIYAANGYSIGWSSGSQFSSSTDGIINLLNSGFNNFNRLNFGGTTNAFPAIKRNGAAIDFRLADDSAFCDISSRFVYVNGNRIEGSTSGRMNIFAQYDLALVVGNTGGAGGIYIGNTTAAATARLTIMAGSTSYAPLQLTAGTNLTTPLNGCFEFDGTNLYFTVGGVRKTVTLV